MIVPRQARAAVPPVRLSELMLEYLVFDTSLPQEYIDWHADLAKDELARLAEAYGLYVLTATLKDDGWGDGMKALHVTVITPSSRFRHLVWHAGNQAFMKRFPGGGAGSILVADLR